MAYGGGHAADLAVFAFGQLKRNPAGGDAFAKANWWSSRRHVWLRIEQPTTRGKCPALANEQAFFKLSESFVGRNALDLRPIDAFVGVFWMQQRFVQFGLSAE